MPGREIPIYRPCGDPELTPKESGDDGFTPAPAVPVPPPIFRPDEIRLEPIVLLEPDQIPVYPLPNPPTGLVATAISAFVILLTWNNPTEGGADSFRIEEFVDGSWATLVTVSGSTFVYAQFGLIPETTHTYRVFSVRRVGESEEPSNSASATLPSGDDEGGHAGGFYNTEQTFICSDGSTKTAAANTFFSIVSQADANNQALAFLAEECPTVCNEAFNDLTWVKTSVCGSSGSASGAGATASGIVLPFSHACFELQSSTVFVPGTLDCDITITGSVSGSPYAAAASVKVLGVIRFQTSGVQSFNETIHINGTNKNWHFTLQLVQSGYDGTGSATLFLGS